MPEAVIVDTVRTPIGRAFKGSLAQLRPEETGAYVIDQLLERNDAVDPGSVEDVFCGCGMPQGLQAFNIGRILVLLSEKLPETVNGVTMSHYIQWALLTYAFTVINAPAISVPCGFTRDGLPVGLQIAGRWRDEVGVLRAAAAFEEAAPWAHHSPRV